MKKSAIFVSIAGMHIIDQKALNEALDNGSITGAGIDIGKIILENIRDSSLYWRQSCKYNLIIEHYA